MTTTVKVEAHCTSDKEVLVVIHSAEKYIESFVLQDGEKAERVVFDDRYIIVREQMK